MPSFFERCRGSQTGATDRNAINPMDCENKEVPLNELGSTTLEEEVYPSSPQNAPLPQGEIMIGGQTYRVKGELPEGWIILDGGKHTYIFHPTEKNAEYVELLLKLPPHPALPKVEKMQEGYLVGDGEAYPTFLPPRSLAASRDPLLGLADLAVFLLSHKLAIVNFYPEDILSRPDGITLRIPPRVARLADPLPQLFNPGFTPPEFSENAKVTGKEAVYMLGALVYYLVMGERPPEEGAVGIPRNQLKCPGLPQILAKTIVPVEHRPALEDFQAYLEGLLMPEESMFLIGGATTIGLNPTRETNEDAFGFIQTRLQSFAGPVSVIRACVADGMGGMDAGEFASRAAIKAFLNDTSLNRSEGKDQAEWTVDLVSKANAAVIEALEGSNGGCTFTGITIVGNRMAIGHVGDTRGYLYNGQKLTRITKDHSLVAALVAMGELKPEEAKDHPDRSKILRSLGSQRSLQSGYVDGLEATQEASTIELKSGQAVLLVSDGVWDEVADGALEMVLKEETDPTLAAKRIIEMVIEAGASDNATAVIVRIV